MSDVHDPSGLSEATSSAIGRRSALLAALHAEDTDCYRLLHGAVEGAPGTTVDRYGSVLLVQTWREPLAAGALEAVARVVERELGVALVPVWNHRAAARDAFDGFHRVAPFEAEGTELGLRYDVSPRHRGEDPLLFLDLRVGRRRVRAASAGRSVLNLFAYTCGVGVAAAAGGAREVLNVDFASSALATGQANAARNGLRMDVLQEDVYPVLRQFAALPVGGRGNPRYTRLAPRTWDLVVLDPVRWAKGRFGAVDIVRDYPSLLKPALLATAAGGAVLATNNVASVDRDEWLAVVRRTAEKAGRELRSLEVLQPEADFPSPDGRPPLKLAWLELD